MRKDIALLALFLWFSLVTAAQVSTHPTNQDFESLEFSHEHARWPNPESLSRDLRSQEDQVRFNALVMLGVPAETAKTHAPEEVSLRFASLGTTDEKQAIMGVVVSVDMIYGAVAAPSGHAWQRIAYFSCWCRYEQGDLLGNAIQVEASPDGHSELVVRASSGGTGLYKRDEVRFRFYRGELHPVLSFESRFRECPLGSSCNVTFRWFYPAFWDKAQGGVLAESHARISMKASDVEFRVPDLPLSHSEGLSCKTYKWNEDEFRYEAFSTASNPCKASSPQK